MDRDAHSPEPDAIFAAYSETLDYLYSYINLEHKRLDRYIASKLDPTRPIQVQAALGNPHERYPSVHIAGTKGKGSVAAMCAAGLLEAGLRVGLYTSPHLREFRERIRVLTPGDADGRITMAEFVDLIERMRPVIEKIDGITWFEIVTGAAFLHFAERKVDVAVIEVGLGGRLDPTNVVTPLISVITSLSLDHTSLLGDTIEQIAGEKGGIIKQGVPVVSASQPPEALAVLQEIADERQAALTVIGREVTYEAMTAAVDGQLVDVSFEREGLPHRWRLAVPLAGQHQQENAALALAALLRVQSSLPELTDAAIRDGLAAAQWSGRLQMLHRAKGMPTLLVDCAHNPDSAEKLAQALQHDYRYRRLWLILGATVDKNVSGMIAPLLPLATGGIIVTISSHPRAASPAELSLLAADLGFATTSEPTIRAAVERAWNLAAPGDLICVTGSIFIVGDLLNSWEELRLRLLPESVTT